MRVLLSAYACDPTYGSERGNGWYWGLHWARAGHTVHVLTTPMGAEAIAKHELPENLKFKYVDDEGLVSGLAKGNVRMHLRYLAWQREVVRVARELDTEVDFDLVHHVTWASLPRGSHLWRLGKPFIFGPVGGGQVAPSEFRHYFEKGWRGERVRTWITKWWTPRFGPARETVRRANLVLAANRETAALATRMGARHVELMLDSGLPESFYPTTVPVRQVGSVTKLLWIGRVYALKGLKLALEALSHVNKSVPVQFTIVGYGPVADRIAVWANEFGVSDRVNYVGRVPWTAVRGYYMSHDGFLFTSLRESFGSQLLEAMACGLPIITLDHHGAGDFVPSVASFKVPVRSPPETVRGLANAVEQFAGLGARRAEMGRAAFAYAKQFSWPIKIAAIERYYRRYCGSTP